MLDKDIGGLGLNYTRSRTIIAIIGFIIIGFWIAISKPYNLSQELSECYYSILLTYTVISFVSIYALNRRDFDVFDPIAMLIILYYGIFVFRPIADIKNNDYYTFGVDPMGGGVKANLIICISFIAFCLGYYKTYTISGYRNRKHNRYEPLIDKSEKHITKRDILYKAYLVWIVSFILSVINLIISGKDLTYIFTIGSSGFISDEATAGGIAALSFFGYSMIPAWLYICIFEKNKVLVFLLSFLMLCVFIVRGTRIVLLIMLSAPILYYYISKKKRPKTRTILIGLFVTLLIMSFIQMSRYGTRTGSDIEIEEFSSAAVTNVFDADLTTYKQFYCIVDKYPSQYDYTYGKAIILQTLVTVIPRSLWPAKPDPVITEVMENAVNSRAAISGMASPGIGEYYFEFGVCGCIGFMFLLGCLFKKWNRLKRYENIESTIMFSTLYGLMFQIIIRTSTASCVYQYLFTVLPILFISRTRLFHTEYRKESYGTY